MNTKNQKVFFQIDEHQKIKETVARLGNAPATEDSHGQDVGLSIFESARKSVAEHADQTRLNPAIAIMDVILAAHRDYNKAVLPHVRNLRKNYPNLTINGLDKLLQTYPTALLFKEIWGHNDDQKFQTLKSVVAKILPMLQGRDDIQNDIEKTHDWAVNANLENYKEDPIGSILNIGVATFQHMRMSFGANVVKPDQRVMEILEREFGRKLEGINAILACEEIAEICGADFSPLLIDRIFVRYGSGYYREKTNSETYIVGVIKKLKASSVDLEIISNATGWTYEDVQNV